MRLGDPSSAELRALFAEECRKGHTEEAAALLGDVVLLVELTADLRVDGRDEQKVREALADDLRARQCSSSALKHLYYLW